jgi:lantibiotic biosynthesis protein
MTASQSSVSHWASILPDTLRPAAEAALLDIEKALEQGAAEDPVSLSGGRAGFALFHAYLGLSREGDARNKSLERSMANLEGSVDALPYLANYPHYYGGYSGVAWTVEHLQKVGAFESEDDLNEDMDQEILKLLETMPWKGLTELIGGLAGLGIYGIERLPREGGKRVVARIIDHLETLAEHSPKGITWFSPVEALHPLAQKTHPQGCYNVGLSHGVPGVLGFLAEAAVGGEPRAMALLEGGVKWLLGHKFNYENGSHFDYSFSPGEEDQGHGSRLAWCYGDLGIACVLMLIARRAKRADWEREALAIARDCARRPIEGAGVMDAGLCHGAIGNAHLFNRIYQASGEELFRDISLRWFEVGLAMRKPGEGVGGFYSFMPPQPEEETRDPWRETQGLLEGAAGIGLALIAGLSTIEPTWDRFLLVNIPPQSR